MVDLVRKLLQRSLDKGEYLAIHKWSDDPTIFIVGKVFAITADRVSLSTIDSMGQPEHESAHFDIDTICGVQIGTPYLKALSRLRMIRPPIERSDGHVSETESSIFADLVLAIKLRQVVRVFFQEEAAGETHSDILPLQISGDWLRYSDVFDNGEIESGESWLNFKMIVRMRVDSDYERTKSALIN